MFRRHENGLQNIRRASAHRACGGAIGGVRGESHTGVGMVVSGQAGSRRQPEISRRHADYAQVLRHGLIPDWLKFDGLGVSKTIIVGGPLEFGSASWAFPCFCWLPRWPRPAFACGQECGKIVSPRRNLLWRAKLADEPPLSPWQVQRINPIAFQAAKRPWPFTVNRHHQYHQAAAVLASPRSISLTHAPV
jgi:hypothetical protein